jgi:hypothetical protein
MTNRYIRSVSTNNGLTKIQKKDQWPDPSQGRQKARPKDTQPLMNQTKGRKLVPLMVGSYLTRSLSDVANMQIMNLIVIGGLEQASPANANFLSIAKAKVH